MRVVQSDYLLGRATDCPLRKKHLVEPLRLNTNPDFFTAFASATHMVSFHIMQCFYRLYRLDFTAITRQRVLKPLHREFNALSRACKSGASQSTSTGTLKAIASHEQWQATDLWINSQLNRATYYCK